MRLGLDSYTLRWQGWDAIQLIEYCAALDLDADPPLVGAANVEDARALEHEPDLVVAVQVLVLELRQHRVEVRRIRPQLDLVLRDIAALPLHAVERRLVIARGQLLVQHAHGRQIGQRRSLAPGCLEPSQLHRPALRLTRSA